MTDKRVAIHTLGCKVNQTESEAMLGLFQKHGYTPVGWREEADVYVINTCTVTHLGDRKSRQMIRQAIKRNPAAKIVVTGCYAQTSPGEVLAIPGVDLVIGTQDRGRLVELVEQVQKGQAPLNLVADITQRREFEELPLESFVHRTRAFVKIQDGCNQFCSYCIVPYARGRVRSRQPDRVIAELQRLVQAGFAEIVLTGIHTSAYGQDLGEGASLASLLCRVLTEVPALPRLRLSSLEPTEITDELIELVAANPALCRHFHIPLQSGHDEILFRMNRHYTTREYRQLVDKIRAFVPGVAITSDVIVGFPGETETHFLQSLQFIDELNFTDLHVFKYSPRAGTRAAKFPNQVAPQVKEERSQRLIALAREEAGRFARAFLGQTLTVLIEEQAGPARWAGYTDNYLRVVLPAVDERDLRGQLVRVTLERIEDDKIIGRYPSMSN